MTNFKSIQYIAMIGCVALLAMPGGAFAQCPEVPPLQNYTGLGTVSCPCFVAGEQAGVVLNAPAAHYPLEILRIGVGWASVYGGSGQQIEQALHVYEGGLPDPGTPMFSLVGPQLTDGVINEFNIEPLPGEVTVAGGPFTVTLEFYNANANDFFSGTVVHDGNGCQAGKNVVFAVPGGWNDACNLGVTGDWAFYVVYRPCTPTGVDDGPFVASTSPAFLQLPWPNPFEESTEIEFVLGQAGHADLSVYNVGGQRVARLANESYSAGPQRVSWDGRDNNGMRLPSGVYFVKLQVRDYTTVRKVLLTK